MTELYLWLDYFHLLAFGTCDVILKNIGNQAVLVPIDFQCILCPYNGNQWEPKLSDYLYSLKYLEEHKIRLFEECW